MVLLCVNFVSFLAQHVAVGLALILLIIPVSSMHSESVIVTKCMALHPSDTYSDFLRKTVSQFVPLL